METNIQPVSDRIVLVPDEAETKVGGIIIPDNAKEKPVSGRVVNVGPECHEVKAGDKVVFIANHGAKYTYEGVEYIILKQQDILIIIKNSVVANR